MKENFLYSYKTILYCNLAHFTLFLHSVTATLIAAAAAGNEQLVLVLIGSGAAINSQDSVSSNDLNLFRWQLPFNLIIFIKARKYSAHRRSKE